MERNSMEFVFMMLDEVGFNEVEANDRFIEIVIEILCESEESTLDWDNPLYGRIAEVFAQEMERKQYDNSLIQKGILFWHLYCKRHSPRIKNPKIYVATLEYFTLDSFAF